MLELNNIRKTYKTADFTQTALDNVSIAFRDNEFVAVLGPSGSGKTTMLNIIGGLDQYDSGDLKIDGVSTKKYKDADWDTYRNNRIGFVFQSYNLIPHQTVLANVELALTLSGVSKSERRERAKEALEKVGLGEHITKRPNQMSGGQMQRVAIARALINDPEILLADEPTGALDTQTGKQVMELLTEIAKDRLVIVVTHNPELAQEYANRIVHLSDGDVISDSRPLDPLAEETRKSRAPRRARMSFLTAIALSFSNLMTKKGRTFVTSLAGSIGIIGIAAILALANGVNDYIENIEQETMSIYPLTISRAGFDLDGLISEPPPMLPDEEDEAQNEAYILKMIEVMFSMQSQNDLASLKNHLDSNKSQLEPYVRSIQYVYDVTPQIYLADTSNGPQQVNPDDILEKYGLGMDSSMGAMATSFGFGSMGMKLFYQMPESPSIYEYQYDVVAGHWPQSHDETVLVLTPGGGVSDYVLYGMGLRDRSKLASMIESVMNNIESNAGESSGSIETLSYETLMSAEFRLINPAQRYQYDSRYGIWVDKSSDKAFMSNLVNSGVPISVVGIVQPKPETKTPILQAGINYTPALSNWLMEEAARSQIVKEQLSSPKVNVLSGKTFDQENEKHDEPLFDFYELITIDEDIVAKAFGFDPSQIQLDFSSLGDFNMDMSDFDLSSMDFSNLQLPEIDLSDIDLSELDLSGIKAPEIDIEALTKDIAAAIKIEPEALTRILSEVFAGFLEEISSIDPPLEPQEIPAALYSYLTREDVQSWIRGELSEIVDPTIIEEQIIRALETYIHGALQVYMEQLGDALQTYLQTFIEAYMKEAMEAISSQVASQIQTLVTSQLMPQIQWQIETTMAGALASLPDQIQNAINIDQEAFASAFQINMGEEEILEVMSALMTPQESTYERNLQSLGYADPNSPSQIDIYQVDFSSKEAIADFLTSYNTEKTEAGETEKVIRYTDIMGAIMGSVTNIINIISYVLIAFVAISLVVSSIMIGIITYVSVLERKKEIGILRAIGASKKDIRWVFNAETLIIGLVAGIIGVLTTLILTVPANIIVENRTGIVQIAKLPLEASLILISISMFLAFIAGLFPSSAAARKDPVEALRSE